MKRILILFSIIVAVTSCRTTRSVEREEHMESVSVTHDTVYSASYRDRLVTDTLHDSVYVREVVSETGDTIYREKFVYRDRKARTAIKHDTVFARAVSRADSSSITRDTATSTGTNAGLQGVLLAICLAGVYILSIVGLYFYHKTGK